MVYLIIPIVCFLVFAGLSWAWGITERRYWEGTVDELDRVLPGLKTAKSTASCLILKVPEHRASVNMTFPGSRVRLKIPLVTDLQRDQRDSYFEFLQTLDSDAHIATHNKNHETLVYEIEGPMADVSLVLKKIIARLLEIDPEQILEFQVFGPFSKRESIDQAALDYRSETYPNEAPEPTDQQRRAGCMGMLSSLFLLPIPFVVAYLEYGYIAASVVLVGIFVLREVYFRWKKRRASFSVGDAFKIAVLVLAGTTIYVEDPLYLQLIPTVGLTAAAVAHALAVTFNLKWPSLMDDANYEEPSVRKTMTCAIIATCVGWAAMSEYLRTVLSLDEWIWYFAFVRIELIFGLLITLIPSAIYFSRDQLSNDNDEGRET
jgi:intracellular septation protein A